MRNLKVLPVQNEIVGFDLDQRQTAQAGAGSSSVQNTYEWERISTAEDFDDTDGGMSMLPGAIPDRGALMAGGQSEVSSRLDRDMYGRPPGLPPSEDELFDQTKQLVRQMVRESLKNNLSAEETFFSAQKDSGISIMSLLTTLLDLCGSQFGPITILFHLSDYNMYFRCYQITSYCSSPFRPSTTHKRHSVGKS